MKTGLRTKFLLLGISLLMVPLLIAIGEMAVRLFAPRIDPLSVFVSSPQLRSDTQGDTTRGLFEFDPLLCWRLKAGLRDVWWDYTPVNTNAQHLRMDRNAGTKAAFRIVVLGDSVMFGYRVPVAHDAGKPLDFDGSEWPCPALLEQLLGGKFSGGKFEVLPLACPGYTSWQGLAWLKRDIARLQPDIVVACFGWNDVRSAGLPDRATMPGDASHVFVRRLIARSQLLLNLAASAQRKQAAAVLEQAPEPRSSEQEYAGHFIEMAETCRQHGAWFGIVLPVYRDPNTPGIDPEHPEDPGDPAEGQRMTRYREQLRETARQRKISFLEIVELTEHSWPGNKDLFGERIHPNAAGHRLMAEKLVEFLSEPLSRRKP